MPVFEGRAWFECVWRSFSSWSGRGVSLGRLNLIDKDKFEVQHGGRTSSKLSSETATSLNNLAPRTSVELICAAIATSSFIALTIKVVLARVNGV